MRARSAGRFRRAPGPTLTLDTVGRSSYSLRREVLRRDRPLRSRHGVRGPAELGCVGAWLPVYAQCSRGERGKSGSPLRRSFRRSEDVRAVPSSQHAQCQPGKARQLLRLAYAGGSPKGQPCTRDAPIARRSKAQYRLSEAEVVALLRAASGPREIRAVFLGICAGLRNAELRGLQRRHFERFG
jgi:hypothetical protein